MRNRIKLDHIDCEICSKKNSIFFCSTYDYSYNSSDQKFNYFKCKTCNVIFLKNRPKFKSYKLIYTDNYKAFNNSLGSIFFTFSSLIGNLLKIKLFKKYLKGSNKILEVGAGNAQLLRLLGFFLKIPKNNFEIIEEDQNIIKKLKKSRFTVRKNYFEKINIKSKRFKLIIMNQVIEHLKNPKKYFKKLNKILVSNGILYIETPTIDYFKSKDTNKALWGGLHAPRHMYIYNKSSLIKIAAKYGFKEISSDYIISPYLLYETVKAKLIKKNLNFFEPFISIYNPLALGIYIILDIINIKILKRYSNMRVILKKV